MEAHYLLDRIHQYTSCCWWGRRPACRPDPNLLPGSKPTARPRHACKCACCGHPSMPAAPRPRPPPPLAPAGPRGGGRHQGRAAGQLWAPGGADAGAGVDALRQHAAVCGAARHARGRGDAPQPAGGLGEGGRPGSPVPCVQRPALPLALPERLGDGVWGGGARTRSWGKCPNCKFCAASRANVRSWVLVLVGCALSHGSIIP